MKKQNIILGLILITVSFLLHGMHYMIFHDLHHIMIFLFADIAFIPLEVLLVSLIIERLIKKTEEEKILKKMHMLVGLFYQKYGDDLLCHFVNASHIDDDIDFEMNYKWKRKQFQELKRKITALPHHIEMKDINIHKIFELLAQNEPLMINLISNPSLQENDLFSDLLLATFHLYDELRTRNLNTIVKKDLDHLKFDCERVYRSLSVQWVDYMAHLQEVYPYLFLTAAKNNPYDHRDPEYIEQILLG
ncbi:MAG: hypothetical protein JXR88_03760 [Clostridia bacterium]|nr:hypothetical protein [Clostridia bacterium]